MVVGSRSAPPSSWRYRNGFDLFFQTGDAGSGLKERRVGRLQHGGELLRARERLVEGDRFLEVDLTPGVPVVAQFVRDTL